MEKKKILIVEDEKDLVRLVQYNLEREGFRVVSSREAEAGLVLAKKERPDLAIVDIMLPKMDGLEFCRLLRQTSSVPVIFLTAKKSETDRILGLKLGGDDYVTKPFSVAELVARVQAILRRSAPQPAAEAAEAIRIGQLEVDLERHEVRVKGRPVQLPPREFQLLKLLIEAKGKVLSRENLLNKIWGLDNASDIDTRTVDQHISRLRRKLGSESRRVATVTNFGYQLKSGS